MNTKKRNIIIASASIVLIFLSGIIYYLLAYSNDTNSLTILEKKWITDNVNNIIDVNIYNDIPVYGYNGEGIAFDFLDYFTESNNIKFNKISYYTRTSEKEGNISFTVLDNNKEISPKDILLYQDHYVILSNNNEPYNKDSNYTLGILSKNKDYLTKYFNQNVTIIDYEDDNKLINALTNGEVNYLALPSLGYMDIALSNKLNIIYHLEDIRSNLVLRVEDETIYNTLKKSYNKYLETTSKEDYIKNYLNIYYKSTETSDLKQKNFNSKTYHYGYVINMPYENYVDNRFVGTVLNYLSNFEKSTGVEIETTKYSNIDDLKSALVRGEVDFAIANFNHDSLNLDYTLTNSFSNLDYVVLSRENINLNSLKGLAKREVSVVGGSLLDNALKMSGVKAKRFINTDELLRNIDDYSIILVDKNTYQYYQHSKLEHYNIILESNVNDGLKFILNKSNEPFNSIFKYYISTNNYQNIKYNYNTSITLDKDYTTIKILAFLISLLLFLIITIILISKKTVSNTIINKEDRLKYIDPMTSLKNRNYLNKNIYKWDDNVIFPQSIVIIDINSLREINDTFGRETGDEIINKVASILINNQLENTDIIRSGGDEFLIYMVGYEEKEVASYARKLINKTKDISHSRGTEMGYSMILDEVKTIDDAINEAVSMMVKNKEKRKSKEKE